jgi:quercetin dioxygenase-like cupin family protein
VHITNHPTASRRGEAEHFSGEVWMDELAAPDGNTSLSMMRVHFAPGARTHWHSHPRGQILHVVDGVGQIQVHGAEVRPLRPGDTAVTARGEWHWHGAAPDATATMLSVQGADRHNSVVEWAGPVTGD